MDIWRHSIQFSSRCNCKQPNARIVGKLCFCFGLKMDQCILATGPLLGNYVGISKKVCIPSNYRFFCKQEQCFTVVLHLICCNGCVWPSEFFTIWWIRRDFMPRSCTSIVEWNTINTQLKGDREDHPNHCPRAGSSKRRCNSTAFVFKPSKRQESKRRRVMGA